MWLSQQRPAGRRLAEFCWEPRRAGGRATDAKHWPIRWNQQRRRGSQLRLAQPPKRGQQRDSKALPQFHSQPSHTRLSTTILQPAQTYLLYLPCFLFLSPFASCPSFAVITESFAFFCCPRGPCSLLTSAATGGKSIPPFFGLVLGIIRVSIEACLLLSGREAAPWPWPPQPAAPFFQDARVLQLPDRGSRDRSPVSQVCAHVSPVRLRTRGRR